MNIEGTMTRIGSGTFAVALVVALLAAFTCSPNEISPPVGAGADDAGQEWECSEEVCDRFDNDCDGRVDEDCPCVDGAEQWCYSANPVTVGIGVCSPGVQSCEGDRWGDCAGQVRPVDEACGDGVDDDCDGQVDDGCHCSADDTQDCYSGNPVTAGVGLCVRGTQSCTSGAWGECAGDVTPVDEQCDQLDNNCNGQVDDGCQGSGGSGGNAGSGGGSVGGTGGGGSGGGSPACALADCEQPQDCTQACADLFACSEKICEDLPLCPGFNHDAGSVPQGSFLSQCESTCDAGQLAEVEPCDCAATVERAKADAQYADMCANGCSFSRSVCPRPTRPAPWWLLAMAGLALARLRSRD